MFYVVEYVTYQFLLFAPGYYFNSKSNCFYLKKKTLLSKMSSSFFTSDGHGGKGCLWTPWEQTELRTQPAQPENT